MSHTRSTNAAKQDLNVLDREARATMMTVAAAAAASAVLTYTNI